MYSSSAYARSHGSGSSTDSAYDEGDRESLKSSDLREIARLPLSSVASSVSEHPLHSSLGSIYSSTDEAAIQVRVAVRTVDLFRMI